ncbi:MAG TPA: hypothetical protein VFS42_10615 [Burkholderiaceae bacterium]|nr:hypothetical protein [Burkholderiaceae bacterium]
MKLRHCIAMAVFTTATSVAVAKLPPQTEEQQAAVAARKAAEQREAEEQKRALERVTDDIARRYAQLSGRKTTPNAASAHDSSIPRAATQPMQRPQGGNEKSAEAHSADTPASKKK